MRKKPNNPRQISKREYARLQADLERFGDLGGIVHNAVTDNIVGGNQRASVFDLVGKGAEIVIIEEYDPPTRTGTAARGYVLWNGEKYDYRCVVWDTETEDAACITANLRGGSWDWQEMAGWDTSALIERGLDTETLATWNADAAELNAMLTAEKDAPPDDPGAQTDRAEELREKFGVEVGQLWSIGEHLLFCGDCNSEHGLRADIVITDPDYSIDAAKIRETLSIFADRAVILTGTKQAFTICADEWRYCLDFVWKHRQPRSFPTKYQPVFYHHNIVMIAHGDTKLGWERPSADFGSIIEIDGVEFERGDMHHAKSADLFVKLISGFDYHTIADPFIGSGTTMVACEQLGRCCVGAEIDPSRVALTLQRLCDMGLEPRLERTL